jgi:hypothetical protein
MGPCNAQGHAPSSAGIQLVESAQDVQCHYLHRCPHGAMGVVEFRAATDQWLECADDDHCGFRAEREKARGIPRQEIGF